MMNRICDVCGKVICRAPFGEIARAMRDESRSRNNIRITTRSLDGTATNYDEVCGECTDGVLAYIASRKEICK